MGPAAASDKPVAELLPPLSEAEQIIRDVLSKQTELRFEEVPLRNVVAQLQDEYGIQVQLDLAGLGGEGIDADTSIDVDVKGVSLGAALRLMLRQRNMSYVVRDDVLQITTQDEADNWLVTRIYPVGDISDQQNFSDLVGVITSTIARATWDEYGGNGSVVSLGGTSSLIISQSQDVHDQVLQLLRSFRTARCAFELGRQIGQHGNVRWRRSGYPSERQTPPRGEGRGRRNDVNRTPLLTSGPIWGTTALTQDAFEAAESKPSLPGTPRKWFLFHFQNGRAVRIVGGHENDWNESEKSFVFRRSSPQVVRTTNLRPASTGNSSHQSTCRELVESEKVAIAVLSQRARWGPQRTRVRQSRRIGSSVGFFTNLLSTHSTTTA